MIVEKAPDFLNSIGPVKNPVLVCSSSFATAMMWFSHDLFSKTETAAVLTGVIMFPLAVVVFLIGLFFYIYAFCRLPSTTQELLFLREAKVAVARHRRSAAGTKKTTRVDD
jgi:hypothetical protein